MKNLTRGITLFFLTSVIVMSAVSQGLYWESAILSGDGEDTTVSHSYYMPKMFKEKGSDENHEIIVRLDKKLFIIVNTADKEYSEMTFDELEKALTAVSGMVSGKMAEMEKQMESLSPEQKKMMMEMMGDKIPGMKQKGKIETENTGTKKDISGFSCIEHLVKRNGETFLTMWTTEDIKGLEGLNAEMKEFGKRMAALNPMGEREEQEAMFNVEGFPIMTEVAGITTLVTRVERRAIPMSEFEVPSGYKKVESEILKGLEQ